MITSNTAIINDVTKFDTSDLEIMNDITKISNRKKSDIQYQENRI